MEPGGHIVFGPYRLDLENPQLWQGEQIVALEPQPAAVLQYLVAHTGQVVSKDELLRAVWPGQFVVKAVVKECIRAIRKALHDNVTKPQYIETIGREGYRFLGTIGSDQAAGVGPPLATPPDAQPRTDNWQPTTLLVGREAELAQLQTALHKALHGERQVVFVTGEPGIGKTTLIERFRGQLQTNEQITIGYGQCVEQYGGGEAYLPLLEAMGRLCRETEGQYIIPTLRQYALTWLVQLSGVIEEAEAQALRLQVQGATQQRMLREMAEALEQLTRQQPLLLVLEDLHWSDHATVELLSYLAQRKEPAQLLILGTYRPTDLVLGSHPLKAIK
jgi:DNA-binding winged helix-turn-helix (wHTH) protein